MLNTALNSSSVLLSPPNTITGIAHNHHTDIQSLLNISKFIHLLADFTFDESEKIDALKKLAIAAKKFDPAHPSSPSLEAFNGKYMSAAVLREMLKRVFNLKVNSKELGAILKEFADNDASDAREKDQGLGT